MQNRRNHYLCCSEQQGRGLWSKTPATLAKASAKGKGRGLGEGESSEQQMLELHPHTVMGRMHGEVNKTLQVGVSGMPPFV